MSDMELWQKVLISINTGLSLIIFFKSIYESVKKKNSYGRTPWLFFLGIFVWGDGVILGLFWIIVSAISLVINNWILFLLSTVVFWLIRSSGETVYWIVQQFSPINRNPPEKMFGYRFFKNNSIWFIYQTFWQVITIISLLAIIFIVIFYLNQLMSFLCF